MRAIWFRGKRKDNGEWVEGHYAKIAVNFGQNDVIIEQTKGGSFVPQFIDIKTLGQFTGLLDKNGKEIYEGDVLGRQSHWSHYVGFNDGSFVAIPCEKVQEINWVWHPLKQDVAELWEVIGNIHDNPELLEVEK